MISGSFPVFCLFLPNGPNVVVFGVESLPFPLRPEYPEFIPELIQEDSSELEYGLGPVHRPKHSRSFHADIYQGIAGALDDSGGYGKALCQMPIVCHTIPIVPVIAQRLGLKRFCLRAGKRPILQSRLEVLNHVADLALQKKQKPLTSVFLCGRSVPVVELSRDAQLPHRMGDVKGLRPIWQEF